MIDWEDLDDNFTYSGAFGTVMFTEEKTYNSAEIENMEEYLEEEKDPVRNLML